METTTMRTTDRATCWMICINNPTSTDLPTPGTMPARWVLEGQMEKGENGTLHYQGMLRTPQVRFKAVKDMFPRARIEVARDKHRLKTYVHKNDTRVAEVPTISSNIPTLFDYQITVAQRWDDEEFNRRHTEAMEKRDSKITAGDVALEYVDYLVSEDIKAGIRGIEFIAINPMWRSSWKKFYSSIIFRSRSTNNATQSPNSPEEIDEAQSVQSEALTTDSECE